jgi:hypothetical protein
MVLGGKQEGGVFAGCLMIGRAGVVLLDLLGSLVK